MATASQAISDEKLSVALLNINGLRNKTHEVRHIITHHKLRVVALCETKLDPSVADSDVYIPGFRMWRKDRDRYGGGVALYVQDHIETRLRSDLMKADVEIIWVEMKLPEGRPVLLGCCYRPSSTNAKYLKKIHDTMSQASKEKENKNIFLMGDFNIDWFSDSEKKKTADLISRLGWTQIVEEATRVTVDSETCIDHIYTNIPDHSESKSIPTGCSDHNLITVKVNRNIPQSKGNFRSNKFDRKEFQKDIEGGDWGKVCSYSNKSANLKEALKEFTKIFLQVADKHAPLKNQDIYCLLTLNAQLKSIICKRDKVKSNMITMISPLIKEKKELQGQINNYLNGKTKRSPRKDNNNNTSEEAAAPEAEHPQETSTENTDSGSVSENSQVKQRKRWRSGGFTFNETDTYTVTKWLEYVCDHVVKFIDETEAELIKLSVKSIKAAIRDILNRCVKDKKLPDELKKIKSFLFSADNCIHIRQSSGADRLHIILRYVFDVILYEQAKPSFIGDENKSAKTLEENLKQRQTSRNKASKANRAVAAVFLDFTSSFDTISHDLLITKLEESDLSDSALTLIKSFLSIQEGSSGLPQGSCLAQLLRIIIINDLKKSLEPSAVMCNSYVMIYADGNPQTIERELDDKMKTVREWAKQLKMSFKYTQKQFKPSELPAMFKILDSMLRCHGDESNWIRAPGNIVKKNGDCKYDNVSKELELHFGPEYKVEPEKVNNSQQKSQTRKQPRSEDSTGDAGGSRGSSPSQKNMRRTGK